MRRHHGIKGASDANDPDPIVRAFGVAMPNNIPESCAWWRTQQKELFAISLV